jgi:hypothetical protein
LSREYCSPCEGEAGELEGEGDATVEELGNGGGSGGALAILELAPGGLGVNNLWRDKLGEPLANQKRKKEGRRGLSFTGDSDDTTQRGTEAAALRASGAPGA